MSYFGYGYPYYGGCGGYGGYGGYGDYSGYGGYGGYGAYSNPYAGYDFNNYGYSNPYSNYGYGYSNPYSNYDYDYGSLTASRLFGFHNMFTGEYEPLDNYGQYFTRNERAGMVDYDPNWLYTGNSGWGRWSRSGGSFKPYSRGRMNRIWRGWTTDMDDLMFDRADEELI